MNWDEFVAASLKRPGMWVPSPYVDGLMTLWCGFSMGAGDRNFDQFSVWLPTDRLPAEGGYRSPLPPSALIRKAVSASESGPLTVHEDERALALLSEVVDGFLRHRDDL